MTSLSARLAEDRAGPLLVAPKGAFGRAELLRPSAGAYALRGERVAVSLRSTAAFIRALLALDGAVEALLLLAPTLPGDAVAALMAETGSAILVSDRRELADARPLEAVLAAPPNAAARPPAPTEWLMTTSGTTGRPKVVRHTLSGLARAVRPVRPGAAAPVWGLLYDPSRFAGLQVVLQALLGGGSLVAPDREGPWAEALAFLAGGGCTHLSATPTLWRKILMTGGPSSLRLRQITLGGEIADDSLLGALASAWPEARVTHIYALTEAGVGFSVHDGRAGFPLDYVANAPGGAALRIADGALWLRPPLSAADMPRAARLVRDADGFIRSGDHVAIEGDRVFFVGREDGVVNVGGVKLHLETIEAVALEHPDIAACAVSAKPSSMMGALLAFDIVPKRPPDDPRAFAAGLRGWLSGRLQREAQPATLRLVDEIRATGAGKTPRGASS